MEIVYHLGAHCTDDEQLIRCLLKNRDMLLAEGISIPGPSRYRPAIRETLQLLRGQPASAEAQEVLLDTILEEDDVDRVVLSNDQFLGVYGRAAQGPHLYPQIAPRAQALRALFPDHDVEFHLAMRDPATLLPALFAASQSDDFASFVGQADLSRLAWSEALMRMRAATPDAPITVWCNEDTPLIWPEVLQNVSGHSDGMILNGRDQILGDIMDFNGLKRMRQYIKANPPKTELQRRKIVAAFLDKYVDEDKLAEEVALPGWTEDIMDVLSELYEQDLARVAEIPGVHLITP